MSISTNFIPGLLSNIKRLVLLVFMGMVAVNCLAVTILDNEVRFYYGGTINPRDNYFYIEDAKFVVTPGQEAKKDNPLKSGLHYDEMRGREGIGNPYYFLIFRAGKSGSSDVADKFNNCSNSGGLSTEALSFTPGKLNFYIVGTLHMNLGHNNTISFGTVCIGQGKAGTKDDWWFGASNGRRVTGKGVYLKASDGDDYLVSEPFNPTATNRFEINKVK